MNIIEKINNMWKWLLIKRKYKSKMFPSKTEYYENIRRIQQNEFASDSFKKMYKFMHDYYNRDCLDIESKLFDVIDKWYQCNDNLKKGFTYDKFCTQCLADFRELASSLTYEQEDSNVYLGSFVRFMNDSKNVCRLILEQIKEKIPEYSSHQLLAVTIMDIPESTLSILPRYVSEKIGIPYYKPKNYKISYVNRLDDEYKHIYSDYNYYASNVHKMAELIYRLQLNELLGDYSEIIEFKDFQMLSNNEVMRSFVVSYSITQKENINNTKTYELSDKTRENIARVIGLPFESIVSMDPDELEKYIHETFGSKHTQESVRNIELAEDKMDKVVSGPQLVLKNHK